ncbi:hypothetical protein F4X90_20580 [Candidatus Poribacteria bacterium]|nr:hypothetical protein [Candidatus Poribacteria bacterium]
MAKMLKEPIEIYRDDYIVVFAMDEKSFGGAHHYYNIYEVEDIEKVDHILSATAIHYIRLQEGPILEHGVNGISNEAMLAIVRDRLNDFQSGDFPSFFNEAALSGVEFSNACLLARTQERKNRGVEGRSEN